MAICVLLTLRVLQAEKGAAVAGVSLPQHTSADLMQPLRVSPTHKITTRRLNNSTSSSISQHLFTNDLA
jgi:hypothetical protein